MLLVPGSLLAVLGFDTLSVWASIFVVINFAVFGWVFG